MADDWRALNKASWNERVAAHLAPGGYDLASIRSGRRRFDAVVESELPPVQGRRVLHLQCHFGLDTLTLAQRGADVTVNWIHPVCDILGALQAAGMRIEWMHEHARLPWRMFQQLVQRDGLWTWPDRPWLPLSLSVLATRVR